MTTTDYDWTRVTPGYYMARISGQTWVIQRDRNRWWVGTKQCGAAPLKSYSATTLAGAKRIAETE